MGKEIEFFHNLGRTKNIHFFIVDGIPHSGDPDTECFNPVVNQLGLPEILGANIHEKIYRWPWLNRERAYVQLVTKLLGVEFDAIWKRHKRQLRRKIIALTVAAIAGISDDLYEAARIDGANRFQQALHVTLPSILPTIMVMLILKIGNLLNPFEDGTVEKATEHVIREIRERY